VKSKQNSQPRALEPNSRGESVPASEVDDRYDHNECQIQCAQKDEVAIDVHSATDHLCDTKIPRSSATYNSIADNENAEESEAEWEDDVHDDV